jgi:hypothetical protein
VASLPSGGYLPGRVCTYHRDSEPTVLGPAVYKLWNDGILTLDYLRGHPGGFLSFPKDCFCHGDSSEICGSCAEDSPNYVEGLPKMFFSHRSVDPYMIEWVYIVDDSWLHILGHYDTGFVKLKRGIGGMYRTLVYDFREATTIYMAGPEPDWKMIELEHRMFMEKV